MFHCMRLKFIHSEEATKYIDFSWLFKLNLRTTTSSSLKWVTKFKAGKQDPTAGTAEHSSIVFRRSTSQRKKKLSKGSCNCIRNGMTYIFIYIHTPFHACFIINIALDRVWGWYISKHIWGEIISKIEF